MGGLQPTLQATAGALLFFPIEQRRDPGFSGDLGPVRHQAVQMQRLGAGGIVSSSVIGMLLQLVIGFKCMRLHRNRRRGTTDAVD
jgi:hypothetical protein